MKKMVVMLMIAALLCGIAALADGKTGIDCLAMVNNDILC